MKAEIKPRIELEKREKLEKVIPIEVPFLIFLDPTDKCNFKCRFCPTGNRSLIKEIGRLSGIMDFKLYQKIIDDIVEFGQPVKVLRLYKDGEPLVNPRLPDMIRYAKQRNCALQVDTTTNGSLLNPEKNLALIEAGLDRLHISLEGLNEKAYRDFAGYNIAFDKLVDNIRHFYENRGNCLVCIKIIGDNLSDDEKKKFYEIFGEISDRIFIEHIAPCWPDFVHTENIPDVGIYGQPIKEVQVCPYIFYSVSINWNGNVSLCFVDWSRELLLGDLKNESLKEIWNGEKLKEYRIMHLKKERKQHKICGSCGQLSHCLPDDIDEFAEILLGRIQNQDGNV